MEYKMIETIKPEIKILKFLNLKSVFCIMGFIFFSLLTGNMVANNLQLPYIFFNIVVGIIVTSPSPFNKGLPLYKSLIIFQKNMVNRSRTYHDTFPYDEEIDSLKYERFILQKKLNKR